MITIPKLKPFTSRDVEACGHVMTGTPVTAAISMQPAVETDLVPHSTLMCTRCALAAAEAVVTAIKLEWSLSKAGAR
jgi:hypothetical protein